MTAAPKSRMITEVSTPETIGEFLFEFSSRPGQLEWIQVHDVSRVNANASWERGGRRNVKLGEWAKMGRWVTVA